MVHGEKFEGYKFHLMASFDRATHFAEKPSGSRYIEGKFDVGSDTDATPIPKEPPVTRLRTLMVNQRDNEALSSAISNMTNSGCRCSNTLSSAPFLDHGFIRVYTVCQLPNRLGNPRHLHPCSATYSMAFST